LKRYRISAHVSGAKVKREPSRNGKFRDEEARP
jgi:hypothetical protein